MYEANKTRRYGQNLRQWSYTSRSEALTRIDKSLTNLSKRLASCFFTYLSSFRRVATIFKSPLVLEWSLRFLFRCSVKYLMRAVSVAIWYSGDPLSVSCSLNFMRMAAMSCALITGCGGKHGMISDSSKSYSVSSSMSITDTLSSSSNSVVDPVSTERSSGSASDSVGMDAVARTIRDIEFRETARAAVRGATQRFPWTKLRCNCNGAIDVKARSMPE